MKYHYLQWGRAACFLLAAGVGPGCVSRTATVDLALRGQEVANAGNLAVVSLKTDIMPFVLADAVHTALTNKSPLSDDDLKTLRKIQSHLDLRVKMMRELAGTYKQLHELAVYNAPTAIGSQARELMSAITDYASAVNPGLKIAGEPLAKLVGTGFELIAQGLQSKKILDVNEGLLKVLPVIHKAMKAEQSTLDDLIDMISEKREEAALSLWKSGVAMPDSLFEEVLAGTGMTYYPESYLYLRKQQLEKPGSLGAKKAENLEKALERVFEVRQKWLAAIHDSILTETLNGLEQLRLAHLEVAAKSRELNLENLTYVISTLKRLTEEASAYSSAHRALRATETGAETQGLREAIVKMILEKLASATSDGE